MLSTVPNKRTACVTSREVDVHHEHQSLLQHLDIALVHVRILVLNDAYLQQLPRLRDVWLLDITRALLPRQKPWSTMRMTERELQENPFRYDSCLSQQPRVAASMDLLILRWTDEHGTLLLTSKGAAFEPTTKSAAFSPQRPRPASPS